MLWKNIYVHSKFLHNICFQIEIYTPIFLSNTALSLTSEFMLRLLIN